jgi:hypothetical protein
MAAVVAATITTAAVCVSYQTCDVYWVGAPKIHDVYCSMRPPAYQYAVGFDCGSRSAYVCRLSARRGVIPRGTCRAFPNPLVWV